MTIHLNMGSNLGDRRGNIARAVALLSARLKDARILLSDYVESEPAGFESPNSFLNRGLLVELPSPIDPERLLDITQGVERYICADSHRNPDGTYRDRTIDIDIIAIEGLTYSSPRLTLPHPRAAARPFVTAPLEQLCHNRRMPSL